MKKSSGRKGTYIPSANKSRAPHVPTEDFRRSVAVLAGAGVPVRIIAATLGITEPTVARHYRKELEDGKQIANSVVVETLFRMAASGRCPAATFFWLKTQAGWREVDRVEHDHHHSGQIGHVPVPLSKLSQATLDSIEADLAKELPVGDDGKPR